MEPKQSGPSRGIERPTNNLEGSLEAPATDVEHEAGIEARSERQEQEQRPPVSAAPVDPSQIAIPSLPQPVATEDAAVVNDVTNLPTAANDDDLIEKEWVDHAKRIISETKDDPYRREQEISKLQLEYVKKRYGRIIGEVSD